MHPMVIRRDRPRRRPLGPVEPFEVEPGQPNDVDAQAMAGFIMQACDTATRMRMAIEMRSEPVMNGTWEEFADAILQWQTEKYEAFLEGHRH